MDTRTIDRNPLAERKLLVGRRASRLVLDANRSISSPRFNLGGNSFSVFRPSIAGKKIAVALVSHLAGIFRGKFIAIWFERRPEADVAVFIRVNDLNIRYAPNRLPTSPQEERYLIFSLNFMVKGR